MEAFIENILQFGTFNKQEIDLIKSKATALTLQKNDHYWEAGKPVKQVGFIISGVLRVFYYDDKGEEITRYFFAENHLILSGHTLDEVYIPAVHLSAITDCKLIVFSKENWKELSQKIADWDNMIQRIIIQYKSEKLGQVSDLIFQDARTRYLHFIENFPTLANRVPLSFIASFLGMTQSSLSRVRKNIR